MHRTDCYSAVAALADGEPRALIANRVGHTTDRDYSAMQLVVDSSSGFVSLGHFLNAF